MEALSRSEIRYVLVRHEQAASFMAETFGRLTGQPGVCWPPWGPGPSTSYSAWPTPANSTPLVALSAQVGMHRSFKESHQRGDLVSMFAPVTKWSALVAGAGAVPEMVRKAFQQARTERPGAVYLAVPEDVEQAAAPPDARPLPVSVPRPTSPRPTRSPAPWRSWRGAAALVVAGHGAVRAGAGPALARFAEALAVPVVTTFHAKGVIADDHPQALGAVGFMRHDYVNFGFDEADVLLCGYELQESTRSGSIRTGTRPSCTSTASPPRSTAATRWPSGCRPISATASTPWPPGWDTPSPPARPTRRIRALLADELARGAGDDRFPMAPARVVADTRAAMGRGDVVLVDTGALKMWMARRYPTYAPNTCVMSNGLSTMAWSLPGAIGAKIARPRPGCWWRPATAPSSMNSQEIETALRRASPWSC